MCTFIYFDGCWSSFLLWIVEKISLHVGIAESRTISYHLYTVSTLFRWVSCSPERSSDFLEDTQAVNERGRPSSSLVFHSSAIPSPFVLRSRSPGWPRAHCVAEDDFGGYSPNTWWYRPPCPVYAVLEVELGLTILKKETKVCMR